MALWSKALAIALPLALLGACAGLLADAAEPDKAAMQEPKRRPSAFLKCIACHSTLPGKNGVGPSLAGVNGRKAGSLPGFSYSEALQRADIIWDGPTLKQFLADPADIVPGMCMPFMGFSDPIRRQEMVDYLLNR